MVLAAAQGPGQKQFHWWGSIPYETALRAHIESSQDRSALPQGVVLAFGGAALVEPDPNRHRGFVIGDAMRPFVDKPHKVARDNANGVVLIGLPGKV